MKPNTSALRKKAQLRLASFPRADQPDNSVESMLHQLQVQQVELEMQYEKLERAQQALETSHASYVDLYEFAPVGYLTLTAEGLVSQINLTGSQLLGKERNQIIRRSFARFVCPSDKDRYHGMFSKAKHGLRQTMSFGLQRDDGSSFHAQLDCVRVKLDSRMSLIRLTITDISDRKRAEEEIENLAFHDPLTRLPNRRLLLDRLKQAIDSCAHTHRHGAILFIDLDEFKTLNDTLGHSAGDLLLQQVGFRLSSCVRSSDTVARLGGDEFVVLLQDLSSNLEDAAAQAKAIGEKLLAALKKRYLFAAQDYRSSGSIGATLFGIGEDSVDDLLKRADLALYRAKAEGGGVLEFFEPSMQPSVTARTMLEEDLRSAAQNGELLLHYQPQVDGFGHLTGVEALVRWQHPRRGLLIPAEFMPLAEESGYILTIGRWVLETACNQLVAWSGMADTAHLKIAVNISAHEFCSPDLVAGTLAIVERSGANANNLVFEITEGLMLGSMEETVAKMEALRAHGMRFSLDDFGTGYSSLSYLKHLPLDQLKIDQSFVRDIVTSPQDAAIACTIMALGRSLGVSVIAAGIETENQRNFLASQGCLAYQGYLFGRPCSVEALHLF